ncbi:Putative ribonuclease CAF1, ribonuclease H-like superfamily [Septoria linicola]|uniref:Ribonuclease CAF1, ribonuclease H-like superfamily n=1 Tax=Septoria linicola TaxID=215465 RepID=A0A9Q9EKE9_9PEZI|nr:putative ribonuclease CAF1, ribonuclease H-like superfamily [Septoria linicola]USW52323.1 Putative ribonuclease CAF1, ribonuclease H-like superfamily [Septoria linicola]
MDVDKVSFYPLLVDILTDISKSHFVAIDLELSGVPTKAQWGDGKPTLQQRYAEIKDAAERYQILQIGLTCVEQDILTDKYILRPYNFDLSPIINEKGLDVERIFSFQSGAAEFLLGVGFDMMRPFARGVPYLSRAEAKIAREKYAKRQDKSAVADIQIKPTEVESLAFLDRIRGEIRAWTASKRMDTPEYLMILPASSAFLKEGDIPEELSRFEKRLVHQLVRAEFPELVTISKRGAIQIVRFNKEREDRLAADRERRVEEQISRQKGFRWIIEALQGGNISNLDLRESAKDAITGEQIFVDMDDYKAQFNRAQALMRGNPRILVGHNCFLDLVYIYRTFIGDLPDTVEDFQKKLHKLFPVIVDTKYMCTHNCGDISPASSLEQIAEQLSPLETPAVETDAQHGKYNNVQAFHEAGYDSYLTAQVAVRLSAKLEREGAYIEVDRRASEARNGIAKIDLANGHEDVDPTGQENGLNAEAAGFVPSVPGAKWKRRGDDSLGPTATDDPFYKDPSKLKFRMENEHVTIPDGMPRFGSDFWRVYGNKLRVFGTQEGVCVLEPTEEITTVESSDDAGGVDL